MNKIFTDKLSIAKLFLNDFIKNGVNIGQNDLDKDPCMLPFIIKSNHEHSIIDLIKTNHQIEIVKSKLNEIIQCDEKIMFISPDIKFNNLIIDTAAKLDMPVISDNYPKDLFQNICINKSIIKKIKFLEELKNSKTWIKLSHFEKNKITETIEDLSSSTINRTPFNSLPNAIFIVDPIINSQAIEEAQKYDILTFSIVNTNSSPLGIDYFIPANNQTLESVETLFKSIFSELFQNKIEKDKNKEISEEELYDDFVMNIISEKLVQFKKFLHSISNKLLRILDD